MIYLFDLIAIELFAMVAGVMVFVLINDHSFMKPYEIAIYAIEAIVLTTFSLIMVILI